MLTRAWRTACLLVLIDSSVVAVLQLSSAAVSQNNDIEIPWPIWEPLFTCE